MKENNVTETKLTLIEKDAYKSKALITQYNKIVTACNTVSKACDDVAKALIQIHDKKLYKKDFETFEASVEMFDISRQYAYKLMNAYRLKEELKLSDYTLNQISEVARVDKEVIKEADADGTINATMKCAKLRDWVDSLKKELPEAEEVESDVEESKVEETTNAPTITFTYSTGDIEVINCDDEYINKVKEFIATLK